MRTRTAGSREGLLLGLVVLAGLMLGGCRSTENVYRPYQDGIGYSATQLTPDVWEVSYEGPRSMSSTMATQLAKVRAAELALRQDRPYLRIEEIARGARQIEDYDPPTVTGGVGLGVGTGGYRGAGVGIGYSPGYHYYPGRYESYTRPITTLAVRFLGEPTEGALEARQVLRDAQGEGIPLNNSPPPSPPPSPATTQPSVSDPGD